LKKLFLFFYLYSNSLFAIELSCNFEEVYKNGEVQEGVLLIKDNMLRYQYSKDNLFTIISKQNNFFLIRNDTKIVQQLSEKTETLKKFMEVASDYPDINNIYKDNDVIIKIEKSKNKFIKRLSVQSSEVNLSINIFNCSFDKIDKKYFRHFDFVEYLN